MNYIDFPEKEINEITTRIKQLGNVDPIQKEMTIVSEYPELYDKYPFLIKKICKGDDMNFLNVMKDKINKINNSTITKTEADVDITKVLTDTYITKK